MARISRSIIESSLFRESGSSKKNKILFFNSKAEIVRRNLSREFIFRSCEEEKKTLEFSQEDLSRVLGFRILHQFRAAPLLTTHGKPDCWKLQSLCCLLNGGRETNYAVSGHYWLLLIPPDFLRFFDVAATYLTVWKWLLRVWGTGD